jgi:hypothetical protein
VKDPIILCPVCRTRAQRVRRKTGYRCVSSGCPSLDEMVASDIEVSMLKAGLQHQSEQEMLAWAKGLNPKAFRGHVRNEDVPL